jgi:HNH endonuclease
MSSFRHRFAAANHVVVHACPLIPSPGDTGLHSYWSLVMSIQILRSRDTAFQRQHGRCYYCDFPMWRQSLVSVPAELRRFECTAEHLVPASQGGEEDEGNIVAACRFCNQTRHKSKHALAPPKYREHVQKRLWKGRWHPLATRIACHVLTASQPAA